MQLGEGSLALRTISGDVWSNGTVAQAEFVRSEAQASPGIPVVAVKGDHDTETTVERLEDHDVVVLDRETEEVADLRVTGAADLGVDGLEELQSSLWRETTPYDDGIADLPPGTVNIGHLHDAVTDPSVAITIVA